MSDPAPVVDLSVARLLKLEERIGESESSGLRARWEFGHELLAARDGKGRLPNRYLIQVQEQTGVDQRELRRRAQFAQRFQTEDELGHAVTEFRTWHAIVNDALPTPQRSAAINDEPLGDPVAGTYRTIAADPPWQYDNRATRGAAEDHYPTMSVEELCALPVAEWAAPEAHLYLWTTNGFLREAFDVLKAWGFEYKTCLTWVKPQLGLGNYFRSSTEHILFGTRGGLGTLNSDQRNWFEAKRTGRHSEKPGAFFHLAELCSPEPRLEMFARTRRFGWETWGNEA